MLAGLQRRPQSRATLCTTARCLRKIADPQADAIIGRLIAGDPSPAVRQGAFFAAGFRRFAPLAEALTSVLRADKDGEMRGLALAVVATFFARDSATETQPLLTWVAHNDPDPVLKEAARKTLARRSS